MMNNFIINDWPKPPGLIKREIDRVELDHVVIIETWDLTVEGCPIISIATPRSTSYTTEQYISKIEAQELELK